MSDIVWSWKRTLGIFTLAVACQFAIGWVRSHANEDRAEIYPGSFAHHQWTSFNGTLGWESSDHGRIIPRRHQWRFERTQTPIDPGEQFEIGRARRTSWVWKFLGIDIRWQQDPRHTECYVRYRSIVIPLTCLSAYLLFRKPKTAASLEK